MMKNLLFFAAVSAMLSGCNKTSNAGTPSSDAASDGGKGVLECIMTRTSIRQFADQPVEREKTEALLRAGMAAPTAVNAQPWHFVVVDDKSKLADLAAANPRAKMLQSARLAIVVCGDLNKTLEGKAQQFWIQDCSAATENILLAAHAMGLGAVWTALYPMEERIEPVREALKLPDTLMPLCTVVVGYPAENPEPKDKWKPENVSYNEFGLAE